MLDFKLKPRVYFLISITHLYMQERNLSVDDFLELDEKYDILEWLDISYEYFESTGDKGVLFELDEYIIKCKENECE